MAEQESLVMTTLEVCELLRISRSTINQLRRKEPTFPKPLGFIDPSRKQLFDREQVLAWYQNSVKAQEELS